jgi:hypothetical protein
VGGGNQNLDLGVTVVDVKLAGASCAALVVSVPKARAITRQASLAPLPKKYGSQLGIGGLAGKARHDLAWPTSLGFCRRLRPSCIERKLPSQIEA